MFFRAAEIEGMARIPMIWRAAIFAAFLLSLPGCSMASEDVGRRLPLVSLIASLDHAGKNSLSEMPRNRRVRQSFAEMMKLVVAGEKEAGKAVARAGYEIRTVSEAGYFYTVLLDVAHAVGPTVVLNAAPKRDLIIQAPHGVADRATDIQSAIALTRLGARALILAGAHRCASRSESACSGKTSICGDGRRPYRSSDGAHNPETRFHAAYVIVADAWPKALIVQLHGFGVKGTDAWVVLSDGSRESRAKDSAPTGRVRDSIRSWFGKPKRAVSCQDPEDERFDYRTLCARTNVQGRTLNGSKNICESASDSASGRFLHVEQAWEIRREVRNHWTDIDRSPLATVVLDALAKTVPCTLAACR
jgi:hypothetical protein